ncbi:hypothetical protein GCM10022403_018280 [Streptomyces coacervatus]|uniref:Uncharacterized protein n=1 Tax=Streptomyces coacervatus TaxID=647381 RepID=A0ABP7H3Y0_9ACTN
MTVIDVPFRVVVPCLVEDPPQALDLSRVGDLERESCCPPPGRGFRSPTGIGVLGAALEPQTYISRAMACGRNRERARCSAHESAVSGRFAYVGH